MTVAVADYELISFKSANNEKKKSVRIPMRQDIIKNIRSKFYTYTGNYFSDVAEAVVGEFYDNGRKVHLLIPSETGTTKLSMYFTEYDSDKSETNQKFITVSMQKSNIDTLFTAEFYINNEIKDMFNHTFISLIADLIQSGHRA